MIPEFKIKLLSKYIIKKFLTPFIYSILSFIMIFIVVEVLQRIRTFHDNNALFSDIVKFYFYKTPFIIIQILPLAAILATIFSLGTLVKDNELTALRSSGIHILKILSPVIIFSFLLGIGVFSFNESLLPYTNYMADKINNERIRKITVVDNEIQANMAYRGNYGELLFASRFYVNSKILNGVTLFIFNEKNELKKMVTAEQVSWEKGRWIMEKGYVKSFEKDKIDMGVISNGLLPFSSTPQDLSFGQRAPTEFSFWELKQYINKLKQSGRDHQSYLADLYAKTSTPFSCFVIVMLGIPIALRTQSGSKSMEFGMSILISFIFWGTNQMFYSLGKNGIIFPFISAWIGNIIFLSAGIYMIYQKR